MKILTLTEPWATLVGIGAKKIETRSWGVGYRGTLGIHAAKSFPGYAKDFCRQEPFLSALRKAPHFDLSKENFGFSLGYIIAKGRMTGCVKMTADNMPGEPEKSFGLYIPDRMMWMLESMRLLPAPIQASGKLYLWEFPGLDSDD